LTEQERLVASILALDLPAGLDDRARERIAEGEAAIAELRGLPERARGANEIIGAMSAAFAFLQSAEATARTLAAVAEHFSAAADKAAKAHIATRHALAWAMLDAGAPPMLFRERYRVDALPGSMRVEIEDAGAIPLFYWRRPEPEIDRAMIRRDLLAGSRVSGARLIQGPPTVRVTAVEAKP
jgi:hypothetical protein